MTQSCRRFLWVFLLVLSSACRNSNEGSVETSGFAPDTSEEGSPSSQAPEPADESSEDSAEGTSTSSTGGEESSETGTPPPPTGLETLTDLFNDGISDFEASTHGFSLLNEDQVRITRTGTTLDVASEDGPFHVGWYEDVTGPFIYKSLSAYGQENFAVTTQVVVMDKNNPSQFPQSQFSSGGLLLRSASNPRNWIMYDFGFQLNAPGTEIKLTIDEELTETPSDTTDALSVHFLNNITATEMRLRVCRITDSIGITRMYFARSLRIGGGWGEWQLEGRPLVPDENPESAQFGNALEHFEDQSGFPTPGSDMIVNSEYLGSDLNVGLMLNAWRPEASEETNVTRADFAYLTFRQLDYNPLHAVAQCLENPVEDPLNP